MRPSPERIAALADLGYGGEEACFLCLAATFSGVFLTRQFRGFVGPQGLKAGAFVQKLLSNGHARATQLTVDTYAYHLFSTELYRRIGREMPSHRGHGVDTIRAHLATLDFVLAHPGLAYLETSAEKTAFFCQNLAIGIERLPSTLYWRDHAGGPAVHYFRDGFPMFFAEEDLPARVVSFSFIQAEDRAILRAFARHLTVYLPLFSRLPEFRFVYLARNDALFAKARELFRTLVVLPLESNAGVDLVRYFAVRKAWEDRQFAALSEEDLRFRSEASERFHGRRFDTFYGRWKSGQLSEAELLERFPARPKTNGTRFEARLLPPFGARPSGEE